MACSRAFMLLCMVVVSMVALLLGGAKATITCSQVLNEMTPCIPYLERGGTPASGCCSGIKTLYSTAHTTADLQGVCNCLKEKFSSIHYSSNNVRFAAGLPAKCGVKIPYKISPSINCKSIK